MSDKHHLIAFAARYARSWLPTLNAFSSIWRLEALLSDAENIGKIYNYTLEGDGPRSSSSPEIIDYFAVGFVTCLEWHARSRLVDLLHYQPDNIEQSDIKMIDKVALSQMTAERVTLPYVVGAGLRVTSAKDYVSNIDRVFRGLRLNVSIEKTLRDTSTGSPPPWRIGDDYSLYDALEALFERRNMLVHEIGPQLIAHFSLRSTWTVDEALYFGRAVLAALKAVEAEITVRAPQDFPNRLDADGAPEYETEKCLTEIDRLEAEISKRLSGGYGDEDGAHWEAALGASRLAYEKEMELLDNALFLRPVRHWDSSGPIRLGLLRSRINYLTALMQELNDIGCIDDSSEV